MTMAGQGRVALGGNGNGGQSRQTANKATTARTMMINPLMRVWMLGEEDYPAIARRRKTWWPWGERAWMYLQGWWRRWWQPSLSIGVIKDDHGEEEDKQGLRWAKMNKDIGTTKWRTRRPWGGQPRKEWRAIVVKVTNRWLVPSIYQQRAGTTWRWPTHMVLMQATMCQV